MKKPILFIFTLALLFSCGNPETTETKRKQEQQNEESPEKEQKKTTKRKVKDDDRVLGYFDIQIDDKTYKSTQLQDNYCDMTFLYKGDESFVTIRFKDVESNDAILLTFYGPEEYMLDPSGKNETFMFTDKDATKKVNLQFIPGDGNGAMMSMTMVEGIMDVTSFDKGEITATFEGKGGKPTDVVTKKNLVAFNGEIKLNTKNVNEMGKDK